VKCFLEILKSIDSEYTVILKIFFYTCIGWRVLIRSACDLKAFRFHASEKKFWEHQLIHNEISWKWVPSPNTEFTHISCKAYTHNLKISLNNILKALLHEALFYGIEFTTCEVMLALKKFHPLDFQINNAQPV
jgi:hypothetical protein